MNSRFPKNALLACGVAVWLCLTGWGMWRLAAYSLAPGAAAKAPPAWPAQTALARDAAHFTAVIALHPECPCSKATVEELDTLLAQTGGRLRVHALFVELPGLPEPVNQSELWSRASRIGGIELHRDVGGTEAHRFGAQTSGETQVFDAEGQLRFQGGITGARGHAGDNPGRDAIVELIAHPVSAATPVRTPVFGCELWDNPPDKP